MIMYAYERNLFFICLSQQKKSKMISTKYQFADLSMLQAKYDNFSRILIVLEIIKLQNIQCTVMNSMPL